MKPTIIALLVLCLCLPFGCGQEPAVVTVKDANSSETITQAKIEEPAPQPNPKEPTENPKEPTENPKEPTEAEKKIAEIEAKSEAGDAKAQNQLGCLYARWGGEDNRKEAIKLFRKAAEQGNAEAQISLFWCYARGNGDEDDGVEAVKWLRKAAEQGNAIAQSTLAAVLGNRTTDGSKEIPPKDPATVEREKEALKWYRKAAKQGNAGAQYLFGIGYLSDKGAQMLSGEDTQKNLKEAVKWFRKAAEQGNAGAQSELGKMYFKGEGVPKDYVMSRVWEWIAVANGSPARQRDLPKQKKDLPKQKNEGVELTERKTEEELVLARNELVKEMIKKNPQLLAAAVKWNGHWYIAITDTDGISWDEAEKYCEERLGGHLVCIETKSEWAFINDPFGGSTAPIHQFGRGPVIGGPLVPSRGKGWLGATNQHKENNWRWINGKPLSDTFHSFGNGQLDKKGEGQSYAFANFTSGFWGSADGNKRLFGSICEWE